MKEIIKTNSTTLLLILVAVLTTLQITTCNSGKSAKVAVLENEIKHIKEKEAEVRADRESERAEKQAMIEKIDSLIGILNNKKTAIETRIKTVPVIVDRLPDNDLLRAVENYNR